MYKTAYLCHYKSVPQTTSMYKILKSKIMIALHFWLYMFHLLNIIMNASTNQSCHHRTILVIPSTKIMTHYHKCDQICKKGLLAFAYIIFIIFRGEAADKKSCQLTDGAVNKFIGNLLCSPAFIVVRKIIRLPDCVSKMWVVIKGMEWNKNMVICSTVTAFSHMVNYIHKSEQKGLSVLKVFSY